MTMTAKRTKRIATSSKFKVCDLCSICLKKPLPSLRYHTVGARAALTNNRQNVLRPRSARSRPGSMGTLQRP